MCILALAKLSPEKLLKGGRTYFASQFEDQSNKPCYCSRNWVTLSYSILSLEAVNGECS